MALIIEDGSVVKDANSYVDVKGFSDFLNARWPFEETVDDSRKEKALMLAMDYIEGLRHRYQGVKTQSAQSLQWPRSGVRMDGQGVGSNAIPQALKNGQMAAAFDILSDQDFHPFDNGEEGAVTGQQLSGMSVQYATPSGGRKRTPISHRAENFLDPLFKKTYGLNAMAIRG